VRTRWTGSTTTTSDGAWHFGRLMTSMAGTMDPALFVRNWLKRWETNQIVNGQTIPARTAIREVVNAWPKLADGRLDLKRAPMRLLAIVNRMDLRGSSHAGEGRFVFGVLDVEGNPLEFTVILEYRLVAADTAAKKVWADEWHKLGTLARGSAEYRAQLERVTNRFARKGAAPGRPNDSAIAQIRTNEIALDAPWELREFRLTSTGGNLSMVPVGRTPMGAADNTSRLARFINNNQTAILNGTYNVPATFESTPFQGGASRNNIDFWRAPGIASAQARHLFSLNTCDGCHGAETNTGFLHIGPRGATEPAPLSAFMTGGAVANPVTGTSRTFNDLLRRKNNFTGLLCSFATSTASSTADEGSTRVH
jgi:hypothetical protein